MKIRFFRVLSQAKPYSRGNGSDTYQLRYDAKQFENAACQGIDTEFFYPPQDKFAPGEAEILKRICVECPVMDACLEWGLVHERYGVWGGTTPYERFGLRKQLNILVSDPAHNK
jgi:WhiB family redox-sensing transcriptional regulator